MAILDEYDVKTITQPFWYVPEESPPAKQITELINLVKKKKISIQYFEEFASPKVAQTIAKADKYKRDTLNLLRNISKMKKQNGYNYLQNYGKKI